MQTREKQPQCQKYQGLYIIADGPASFSGHVQRYRYNLRVALSAVKVLRFQDVVLNVWHQPLIMTLARR